MTAYVDSSVLLRIVLGDRRALRRWNAIKRPVSSELIRLECLRTIDRARVQLNVPVAEVASGRSGILRRLEAFDLIQIDSVVLERAAEPFPTLIGSLDAIHLASALLARTSMPGLVFATHDDELAMAAVAVGFPVLR